LLDLHLLERKWKFLAIVAGIILIEIILSLWTGLPYDMAIWFNTGKWMTQGINIYEPPNHLGYPPLWAFWCSVAYYFYIFFGSMEIWRFIIKLPLIFAHIGLAFAIKKFVTKRFDAKTGMKLFLITLTWSFFIYIGAMWGQINTLTALLTFLAFYFAIKHKTFESAFFLGTSITLKIFPLVALPAFFAFFLKNRSKNEATKFLLMTCFVPIIFTSLVFVAFNWDIMFFLRTVFYSTPVLETNPVQILGGCMNVWSFLAFLDIDIGTQWFFRLLWIPILAGGSLFLLKTKKMDEYKFSLSIVSLYILFMISYGWISEQSFLEPLPFIFLILFVYKPKKIQVYLLVTIQIFIYLFSLVNWGPAIFEPLVERFFPTLLGTIDTLNPSTSSLVWTIRGVLGLSVSLFLGLFMILLLKQDKNISLSKSVSGVWGRGRKCVSRKEREG